jgi:hypothetical protein
MLFFFLLYSGVHACKAVIRNQQAGSQKPIKLVRQEACSGPSILTNMQVQAATTIHLGPWRFLNLFGIEAAGDPMIETSMHSVLACVHDRSS